jgi:hypothetical protein
MLLSKGKNFPLGKQGIPPPRPQFEDLEDYRYGVKFTPYQRAS